MMVPFDSNVFYSEPPPRIHVLVPFKSMFFWSTWLNLDAKSVKDLAFQLKAEHAPFYGVFAIKNGPKANLSVAISDDVIADKGLKAGDVVKDLAQYIRGGGGGQPMFASAGGSHPDGIKEALSNAEGFLKWQEKKTSLFKPRLNSH